MSGRYPRAAAVYDGAPSCIAAARDIVAAFLTDLQAVHGLSVSRDAIDFGQLVVSELVTNSVKYAPGPCVVSVETDGVFVVVEVWDSEVLLPQALAFEPARVGQHGLEIVQALCESLEIQREPVGKRITARIPLAPTAKR
ncbi:ATP-binding protein [Streptomyces fuscigenes]|uniref:ATP-binding protein n=1 Tax=Streptomyces fuscigenes TaxID=1528880 RepID=UPI001F32458C|nr:ATP-binding protein [Streptomyces fuscigenes]MCF3960240.1 ATP-binding protein [Streptomyces fuscigenes]